MPVAVKVTRKSADAGSPCIVVVGLEQKASKAAPLRLRVSVPGLGAGHLTLADHANVWRSHQHASDLALFDALFAHLKTMVDVRLPCAIKVEGPATLPDQPRAAAKPKAKVRAKPASSKVRPPPVYTTVQLESLIAELGREKPADRDAHAFDVYAFADYRGDAQDSGNGIELAVAVGAGPVRLLEGVTSRKRLAELFGQLLQAATGAGLRVLGGQDHQYGIPKPFADELGLPGSWREAMRALFLSETYSKGAREGLAGRFGAELNAWLRKRGLPDYFWSGSKSAHYKVPRNDPRGAEDPTVRRITERGMGFPLGRIGDNGSVGGQSIVGIPHLLALMDACARGGISLQMWPFDGLDLDSLSGHVFVEPYPSLVRAAGIVQSDANDALAAATWARDHDRAGKLRAELDLRSLPPEARAIARFEGWIAGHRWTPPDAD